MADVTGPIGSLPGSLHDHPNGARCDYHPDRPAIARYQGETDSFGSEMHDLCKECLAEFRAADRSPEARTGRCDWCKEEATDLRNRRDYDEGMAGPVYRVCGDCVKRDEENLRAELAEYEDDWPDDDYADRAEWKARP